jgi:hypothetical protein
MKLTKLLIFILLLTASCRTTRTISEQLVVKDTTIIHERWVDIEVPGGQVDLQLDTALLRAAIREARPGQPPVIVRRDPDGAAELRLRYDSAAKAWQAECEALERTYQAAVQDMTRIIDRQKKEILERQDTAFGAVVRQIKNLLTWAAIIAGVAFVLIQIVFPLLKKSIWPI